MSHKDIMKSLKLTSGGKLTEAFNDLISCDFIRKYNAFGNKNKGAMFQLTDLYTLFYLHYVKGNEGFDEHLWSNVIDSPSHHAWSEKLLDRRETFREATNTNKALHLTLVTASGLKKNAQAGMIQSEIVLDDLFQEKT